MVKLPISSVRGIIPFYKEKGTDHLTILRWVKLHIAYEYPKNKIWFVPRAHCFRGLEPYASGVMTIGIGSFIPYIKYLAYCDCRYSIDLQMGRSTTTDYHTGPVIESKPFDHVKLDALKQACLSFIGSQIQVMPSSYFTTDHSELDFYSSDGTEDGFLDESDLSADESLGPKVILKNRGTIHHRKVDCHEIEITHFDPPNVSLQIYCGHTFVIRTFIRQLLNQLNTCGSLFKLERLEEGPFTLEDCIDRTDLYLKYLLPALTKHSPTYVDHVRQHLDKVPFYRR